MKKLQSAKAEGNAAVKNGWVAAGKLLVCECHHSWRAIIRTARPTVGGMSRWTLIAKEYVHTFLVQHKHFFRAAQAYFLVLHKHIFGAAQAHFWYSTSTFRVQKKLASWHRANNCAAHLNTEHPCCVPSQELRTHAFLRVGAHHFDGNSVRLYLPCPVAI
eukprot:1159717-Pelagomonas_calceolata.AAC.6